MVDQGRDGQGSGWDPLILSTYCFGSGPVSGRFMGTDGFANQPLLEHINS